jgi:transcriptional regulator with XRE-family HTH domain
MVASHEVRHSLPSVDRLPWLLPELRARAGLTQQQLADRLGSSLPTVQRLESGAHPATMKRTWQLADALGLSGVELVALVDAADDLREAGDVQGWLDRLSWLPNPNGPLQRPALVAETGLPGPPRGEGSLPMEADPEAILLQRVHVFGLLLGQLRARVHLPIPELALMWGPSASTIKRFEGGKSSPDLRELAELAFLLGLSRTELVALAEGLLAHLDHRQVPRRRRPELLAIVRSWLESFYWIPNPGQGLLASRPAGHRWMPAKPTEHLGRVVAADVAPSARKGDEQDEAPSSRSALLHAELVRPAAIALAEPLRRGWSVVGAALPPVPVERRSLSAVVATELIRVLDGLGWQAWPALLVRPGRVRSHARSSWKTDRPLRPSTVTPAEALLELVQGSPWGPWRLVIVEGLETLDQAGLGRRQPAPQLQGAALAVLEVDPAARSGDVSQVLGRPADFALSAVRAMDAGLLPGVRFHGVLDPVEHDGSRGFGGLKLPQGPTLCDDRRLDAVVEAGAFGEGRCTLLHVADAEQEASARAWLTRRLGQRADQVRVALRSSAKLRFKQPVDEVVLAAAEYPATLIRQVLAALRQANLEAGLDVWELQVRGAIGERRRGALATALGAPLAETWHASDHAWASPRGRCTFDWQALPDEGHTPSG